MACGQYDGLVLASLVRGKSASPLELVDAARILNRAKTTWRSTARPTDTMKKDSRSADRWQHRLFASLLPLVLLGGMTWYLLEHKEELQTVLSRISASTLLVVALLRLTALLCMVQAALALLKNRIPDLSFPEYLMVSTMGLFAGYLSPGGSSLSKAAYLKALHQLPISVFAGLQASLLLAVLATSSLIGMVGLWLLGVHSDRTVWPLWSIAFAGLAIGLLPLIAGSKLPNFATSGIPWLQSFLEVWRESGFRGRWITRIWPWLLMRSIIGFLGLGYLLQELALAEHAFLVGGTLDNLSATFNVIRVTPGNLGTYEWGISLLGSYMGVTLSSVLVAALIYRVLGIVSAGVISVLIAFARART